MNELVKRFVEFEFDGNRKVTGVVMKYGDIAEMPWGEYERFETGAFGNAQSLDVILNLQHDRVIPLCRTGGGGLLLSDDQESLKAEAEMPETQSANDALVLVRNKVLRGFSVEFRPLESREEMVDGKTVTIIEKAELVNIGLVDRPAYSESRVNPRRKSNMDEDKIGDLIDKKLKEFSDSQGKGSTLDLDALGRSMREIVKTATNGLVDEEKVREQIDAALKARDEAEEETRKAEQEKTDAEDKAKKDREQATADAENRAMMIVQFRSLLPDDFDMKGKTTKDILVAAAGEEIKDAENESEDYLRAKLEGMLEKRGGGTPSIVQQDLNKPGVQQETRTGSFDLNSMIEKRRRAAFASQFGVK